MDPIVYLPIEIKYRELPSRLLIASHLLQAGYTVVIGNHWSLTSNANLAALPPGVFLFKSVNKIQGAAMAVAKMCGHAVAANDEEALNAVGDSGFVIAFGENAADACDLFLAQSPAHLEAVTRRFPQLSGKVRVAGSPRIDLMLDRNRAVFEAVDDRVAALQPYILFNTNYGTINSVWNRGGGVNLNIAKQAGAFDGPDPAEKRRLFDAIIEWESRNYEAMVKVMRWAAQNMTGLNLVIRPHPGETPEIWESAAAGASHIHVIKKSDPHPWITGSKFVVHTGCTTGLEAVLLDRPVVNLMPTDHPDCDRIVTYVNATCRTWEGAAQAMSDFLTQRTGPVADNARTVSAALEVHFPGYQEGLAAKILAEALAAELTSRGARSRPVVTPKFRAPFTDLARTDLQKEKMMLSQDEIAGGLSRMSESAGVSAAFRLEALGDSLFLLRPV